VRVRTFELRLLAGALAVGWAIAAGLILLAYRPGGPIDLVVGLAAGLPILVAVVALAWPPVSRDDSAFAAIVWLGVGALLLLAPSIAGVFVQLRAAGPQTLVPSPEAGYPWFLALLGTSVFAGLGVARTTLGAAAVRRRRLVRGTVLGLAATLVVAAVFAGVTVANEAGLRDRPVVASRFGPTSPAAEPPLCAEALSAGPAARVEASFAGDVDGRPLGTIELRGIRSGSDFRWLAYAATKLELGQYGWARLGSQAWVLAPGRNWTAAAPADVDGGELDARVVALALGSDVRNAAEIRGVDVFEGARARHCRVAIDGDTFRAAFPQVRWLLGDADLGHWRGELDYWIFVDGQLGRASVRITGEGGRIADGGLLATVRVTLSATDRDDPHPVAAPAT
jgi:hypothetical protein